MEPGQPLNQRRRQVDLRANRRVGRQEPTRLGFAKPGEVLVPGVAELLGNILARQVAADGAEYQPVAGIELVVFAPLAGRGRVGGFIEEPFLFRHPGPIGEAFAEHGRHFGRLGAGARGRQLAARRDRVLTLSQALPGTHGRHCPMTAELLKEQRVLIFAGLGLDTIGGIGGRNVRGRELLNFDA